MHNSRDAYHRLWGTKGQPIPRKSLRRGYSRMDLLLGLVIVCFGGSLLVMWLSRQTTKARRTRCEQKQIVLWQAIQAHTLLHGEYPGWLQNGAAATHLADSDGVSSDEAPSLKLSWAATILPWIGRPLSEEELAGKRTVDKSIRGPRGQVFDQFQHNQTFGKGLYQAFIGEFLCPDDPRMIPAGNERAGWMSYVANSGKPDRQQLTGDEVPDAIANGVFLDYTRDHQQRMTNDFIRDHDGESYTLLLSENIDAGLWSDIEERQLSFLWNDADPAILAINVEAGKGDGSIPFARPSSRHLNGVNAIFAGGNAQFINQSIDPRVLRQMMMSDEGIPTVEPVETDAPDKP